MAKAGVCGAAVGLLLATALGAQAPPPPPAWWASQGAPRLEQVHDDVLRRRQVPYMHQRTFLDLASYRRRVPDGGTDPLAPAREGRVWVGISDRFLVSVGAAARREILARILGEALQKVGGSVADPEVKAFLDFSARSLDEGDTVVYLYAPAGRFWVRYNGEPPRTFRNAPLYRAMLALEFGPDPDNPQWLEGLITACRVHLPPS